MKCIEMKLVLLAVLILLTGCAAPAIKKAEQEVIFYPSLPQQPKLQFLTSISSEDDLGKEKKSDFKEFLVGKEVSTKQLGKPYDIGSSKGKLFILDKSFNKLIIIDLINKQFDSLKDQRLGALNDPSGIWISEDETKYITDIKRKQVIAFGPDNKFLKAYGSKDIFERPVDVAVFENNLYVADMEKNQIIVLDKLSGKLIKTIGKGGFKEGEFYKPTHVVVDREGNIFVNDAFNYRVQKLDAFGKHIRTFGQIGDTLGSFARPKGIAIANEGHLYVADAAFENVQIFDGKTGELLFFFGGSGSAPGSMYLPAGIHVDYDNVEYFNKFADRDFKLKYVFYVLNTFGNAKINVYGFGDWIGKSISGASDS
jgi:DNA-binding beta-propeller fold protein YncE